MIRNSSDSSPFEHNTPGIAVLVIREVNSIVIAHCGQEKMTTKIPFGTKSLYDSLKLMYNITEEKAKEMVCSSRALVEEDNASEDTSEDSRLRQLQIRFQQLQQMQVRGLVRRNLEDIITYAFYAIRNAGLDKKINRPFIIAGELSYLPGLKTFAQYATGLECEICIS